MNNSTIFDRFKIQLDIFIQAMHDHGVTRRQIWTQLQDLVDSIVDLEPGEILESEHENDIYQRLVELMIAYRSHFERDYFTSDLTRHLISYSIDLRLNDFYERHPIVVSVDMEIETDDLIAISPV